MSPAPVSPVLPDPEPVVTCRYTVSGPHRVLGHAPGQQFEAEIPTKLEEFLLSVGHIKTVTDHNENEEYDG